MATITARAGKPTIPGEVRWYPMAVSQTFEKGEFVYLSSVGQLTVCAADPAGICGMAMCGAEEASAGAATTNVACPVTLAKRGQQFTLHICNGASTLATANAQVGNQCGLYVASNIHYADYGDRSNKRFVIDDIGNEDVVGDTTGRVIMEVIKGYAQLDQSTS